METYLRVAKVARIFGVGIPTVSSYIRSGELPAARIGRRFVVSGDDVDRFFAARLEAQKEEETDEVEGRVHKRDHRRRGS